MSDFRLGIPLTTNQSLNQAQGARAVGDLRGALVENNNSTKIDKAARDFESILVGQWLEQAEKSFASVPGTDPDQQNDSSRDQFLGIACQSLAQGISKTGGFGIAAMLNKQLHVAADREKEQAAGMEGNHPQSGGNVKLLQTK